jgi:hypothetical protein
VLRRFGALSRGRSMEERGECERKRLRGALERLRTVVLVLEGAEPALWRRKLRRTWRLGGWGLRGVSFELCEYRRRVWNI